MDYSIIIPAYNEEKYIKRTLTYLYTATKKLPEYSFEIIVVNDGSTDKTEEVVRDMGIKVINAKCRHLGKIRNKGAEQAKGKVLLFVDADTLVSEEVLERMIVANEEGYKGGCEYALYYGLGGKGRQLAMACYTWWIRYVFRVGFGYFIWCDKELFNKIKGFTTEYYLWEDVLICREIKKKTNFYFGKKGLKTSGRKAWTHNIVWQLPIIGIKVLLFGVKQFKTKDKLNIWYDGVR